MNQEIPQQPEILLQLRQKAAELRKIQTLEKEKNKNLVSSLTKSSEQLNTYLKEKQIQERKQKSLMLLVNDIQRQIDDLYGGIQAQDIEEETMLGEAKLLRQMLIKTAEKANQNQKMLSFLRQAAASGPKAQQFIYRSKYLEGQTQLLAKLRSQIASFQNPNLQCSRKWSQLVRQTIRLNKEQGFLRVQLERLKTELRDHYEQYLQSLNRSKASLVNFNQTQREKIITQHLVEQVALLQENRQAIQQQCKNLKYHQQALLQENARLQMQNRQLRSFFIGPTGEEEHKLASKMRTRIEQLRDCLAEAQRIRSLPQLPVSNLAQSIRSRHKGLEQTIAFLEKKIRQEQQGKSSLDERQIISFFEGVLRNRDERLQITKQREFGAIQKLKQLRIRKQLLLNQIDSFKKLFI